MLYEENAFTEMASIESGDALHIDGSKIEYGSVIACDTCGQRIGWAELEQPKDRK
jgi:hypothetical protein